MTITDVKTTTFDLVIVLTQAPYGSSRAREGIEAALAAGAFEQKIALVFLGDALYQLQAKQDTLDLPFKNHQKMASALPMFGIEALFACRQSLQDLDLKAESLRPQPTPLSRTEIAQLTHNAKHILSF